MNRQRNNDDEPKLLKTILDKVVSESPLQKGLDRVNLEEVWRNSLSPAIAKYTLAVQFRRGTLYVKLSDATLRHELSYGKQQLITIINENVGKPLVEKLVLQ